MGTNRNCAHFIVNIKGPDTPPSSHRISFLLGPLFCHLDFPNEPLIHGRKSMQVLSIILDAKTLKCTTETSIKTTDSCIYSEFLSQLGKDYDYEVIIEYQKL